MTRWLGRAIAKLIARNAIDSSFAEYNQRLYPLGVMDREGTVALRIQMQTQSLPLDALLNVFRESTGDILGVVQVVELLEQRIAVCTPHDRRMPEFWDGLEARMRRDRTQPEGVYLTLLEIDQAQEQVLRILDAWRNQR